MTTSLWWIRRDLHLTDNQALLAALAHANQVIPVFVIDPALLNSPYVGEKRLASLFGGLRTLDADLRLRGSRLVVRQGNPAEELAALASETDVRPVFAEEDYSPYARRRDARVSEVLPLRLTGGLNLDALGDENLKTKNGRRHDGRSKKHHKGAPTRPIGSVGRHRL